MSDLIISDNAGVINIRVPISDFQVPNVSSRQEEAQHRQSDAAVMNDGGDNILLTTLLLMEQKASTGRLNGLPDIYCQSIF